VVYVRRAHKETVGTDDFLALGLIALAYAVALWAHAYGFLAVFAAGLALRRMERLASPDGDHAPVVAADVVDVGGDAVATHPHHAPAHMAESVLGFNERLERIAEVAVVVIVGVLMSGMGLTWAAAGLAAVLLFVFRPLAVLVGLAGAPVSSLQRGMTAWFGIRGIGSIYYLAYARNHGLPAELGERLALLTLTVVGASVVLHGMSVTPLMRVYARTTKRGRRGDDAR
jgi:NhaP-type Na+/H+ or K+/H+ antiporter